MSLALKMVAPGRLGTLAASRSREKTREQIVPWSLQKERRPPQEHIPARPPRIWGLWNGKVTAR